MRPAGRAGGRAGGQAGTRPSDLVGHEVEIEIAQAWSKLGQREAAKRRSNIQFLPKAAEQCKAAVHGGTDAGELMDQMELGMAGEFSDWTSSEAEIAGIDAMLAKGLEVEDIELMSATSTSF